MIAVLIPAHDEAATIGRCLASVRVAAAHPALLDEPVIVVVALDRCSDSTGTIALEHGARVVVVDAPGGVGAARAAAARVAISLGARWLAMTDADSWVPPDWLAAQLGHCADAFCGLVEVIDWEDYAAPVREAFGQRQHSGDDHPHVHGANLGVSTELYLRSGGFLPLRCSEDVALVQALVQVQASIARKARPAVRTSARRQARASGGFSHYLQALEESLSVERLLSPHAAVKVNADPASQDDAFAA